MFAAWVTLEAAAAAVKSFPLAGALHRVASEGPVFGLGEGPSTLPSHCLFPTVLLCLPVLFYENLKPEDPRTPQQPANWPHRTR